MLPRVKNATTRSTAALSRRRDPEATRLAILDAAEDLFVTQGVDATPTSQVARRAGVTKSLIHHHFGSKEELWNEVKRRRFSVYYDLQKRMLEASPGSLELLRDSIVAYFRFLQADPNAVRFMGWRFVDGDDPCLEQEEELYELGIQRIREAQEAGLLRSDVEPISVLKAFLGLVFHWFQSKGLLCRMMGSAIDPQALEERYLEDVLRIFFEGLLPR